MKSKMVLLGCMLAFMGSLFVSCSTSNKVTSRYEDVLTYPLAYDLTYIRTLEALERIPDWELERTEKEKGVIQVRNINFSRFADQDKRVAVFLIKRIDRAKTSVQLAPESQEIAGGDKLLAKISEYLSREIGA